MSSPCSGRLAEVLAVAVLAVNVCFPATKATETGLRGNLSDEHDVVLEGSISSTCEESQIMMDPAEFDLMQAFLHPEVVMFEFGSGGSTVAFSRLVKKLYAAEHSPTWAAEVQRRCEALGISNVEILSALPNRTALDAIGVTDCGIFLPQMVFDEQDPLRRTYGPNLDPKWRDASAAERTAVFSDYLKLIQMTNESRFDVVLVDGRVRGECAIAALPYVDERSVVIIHDWFLEEWGYEFLPDGTQDLSTPVKVAPRNTQKSYRQVLDFYEIFCRVSPQSHPSGCSRAGMVVLRKKLKPSATI